VLNRGARGLTAKELATITGNGNGLHTFAANLGVTNPDFQPDQ